MDDTRLPPAAHGQLLAALAIGAGRELQTQRPAGVVAQRDLDVEPAAVAEVDVGVEGAGVEQLAVALEGLPQETLLITRRK